MPMPKHREPLVTKAFSIAERQWDDLVKRGQDKQRSVSHLVREALDGYLAPGVDAVADTSLPEREQEAVAV